VIAERQPARHLRPRGDGLRQPTTTVELFFDLVYVLVGAGLITATDAHRVPVADLGRLQQQQEGTS
jgi:hypothetical protein